MDFRKIREQLSYFKHTKPNPEIEKILKEFYMENECLNKDTNICNWRCSECIFFMTEEDKDENE